MKKIAFIVLTLITLLITLRIDYNFSKNSNNLISMYEEKGNQIKSIKKIPFLNYRVFGKYEDLIKPVRKREGEGEGRRERERMIKNFSFTTR